MALFAVGESDDCTLVTRLEEFELPVTNVEEPDGVAEKFAECIFVAVVIYPLISPVVVMTQKKSMLKAL